MLQFYKFKCFVFAAAKIGLKVESWNTEIGAYTSIFSKLFLFNKTVTKL